MTEKMQCADVDGGARFTLGVPVSVLLSSGVRLDAVTDTDVGADECRVVCEVLADDDGVDRWYSVEFLQMSLTGALAGNKPRWTRGDHRTHRPNSRLIETAFSTEQLAEISAYETEYATEVAGESAE
jgi:hypothetical protein